MKWDSTNAREPIPYAGKSATLRLAIRRGAVLSILLVFFVVSLKATTPCSTVTSIADNGSSGTLRFAIAQANSGSCDTVVFNLGVYPATITLTQGQLEISSTTNAITISGPGALNLAISGNNATRVFLIDSGATVGISGITISSGNSTGSPNGLFGGGLLIGAATVTITNSTLSGNWAFYGGGIYNSGGTLTITSSTFSANNGNAVGGGIANQGPAKIINSTFSGNTSNYGGGVYNGNTAVVVNSTFSGNFGQAIYNEGTFTIKNSLLANSGEGAAGIPLGDCVNGGTLISGGFNLADDASCSSFTAVGDLNNTPAMLDPDGLKNNGGPTQTIAILPDSPAFNAIPLSPPNYCTDASGSPISFDQRGVLRPQGLACDIGAFEYSSDDDSAFADLSGGNAFSGNQSVNGTVSATGFVGNGSGLTGVNALTASTAYGLSCSGCVGNSQLGVSYAQGDTQGGSAVNALALGGFPASAFAPVTGSSSYVAKTGDTMTGALNLPTDGLIAGGNEFVLTGGNVGLGTATPEVIPGYTSLHIDHSAAGFGGSFLELTHSPTGVKGRLVMDDVGFLLESVNGEPVKIKSGNFNNATDPGHIYITSSGNVGLGTGTPAAMLEVNGTAKFDGTVTFAPGQTFPGSGGTITAVTAGPGLSGGGATGTVSLSVDPTVARTNTSNSFSAAQTVSGSLTATSFAGNGAGLTNLSASTLTGTVSDANLPIDVARIGLANSFTNTQAISFSSGNAALTVRNSLSTGVQGMGGDYGVLGMGPWGVRGVTSNGVGVGVEGDASTSIGVEGQSYNGTGVYGETLSTGIAGRFNTNGGKILSGQNNGTEVFAVANNGSVNTSGSLATSGPVTIGGGTPIAEHLSLTFSLNVPSLRPSTCTTSTFTFAGASDGDTAALGVPNALMSPGLIIYSAWVSAGNTVTIRACNVNPNGPPTSAAPGTVRVDIWKH